MQKENRGGNFTAERGEISPHSIKQPNFEIYRKEENQKSLLMPKPNPSPVFTCSRCTNFHQPRETSEHAQLFDSDKWFERSARPFEKPHGRLPRQPLVRARRG